MFGLAAEFFAFLHYGTSRGSGVRPSHGSILPSFPVISSSVTVLLYGIMLLMGFNIYYNVSTDFKTNPDKYYERLGQQAAKTIPYFTKALIPDGVSLNDSFEALINKEAQNRPEYKYSSEFERQILVNEARKAFQNQFQITASNDDTLADIVAQVTINKIRQAMEPYQNYLPVIFAILITSLLYTFAFLIRWLVIIFSWILFRILIMTSFFRLEKVQVEVEKLNNLIYELRKFTKVRNA
jgi:hypothetical protein